VSAPRGVKPNLSQAFSWPRQRNQLASAWANLPCSEQDEAARLIQVVLSGIAQLGRISRGASGDPRRAFRACPVKFDPRPRHAIVFAAAMLAVGIVDGRCGAAIAQGKLDARYAISLAGVPVGHGTWIIDIGEDRFSAKASGRTAGLLRLFANGHGQSTAHGTIANGQFLPATYASAIYTDKKYDDVRMTISGGVVREFVAEPPTLPAADRVPLTEAHRRGVEDPMTASLFRVPGTGSLFIPEACPRKLSIFDGRMRYDLHLTFKRIDSVKSEQSYQGKVVVCSVIFSPIAGHVPDRAPIKYLADLREIEASLAPIAGTRVLAPYRVAVPTPIGLGVMQATQFVSTAQPSKPRAAAKTQ
jgi:hypothetical protein